MCSGIFRTERRNHELHRLRGGNLLDDHGPVELDGVHELRIRPLRKNDGAFDLGVLGHVRRGVVFSSESIGVLELRRGILRG